MAPVKISIIIVNWNTRELLRDCLESVYRETGIPLEVLVVDNGSADGSTQMIRGEFPQVCLIENEENVGFARANNQAIRHAGGDYIVLLNSDTQVLDGALVKLADYLRRHPQVAVVGPKLLTPEGRPQRWAKGSFPSLWTAFTHYFFLTELLPGVVTGLCDNRDYEKAREMDWVSGACMMIRRSVLDQVGLLDESIFMYAEDVEFCRRVVKAGWKVVYLPTAMVRHYQSQSVGQRGTLAYSLPLRGIDAVYGRGRSPAARTLFRLVMVLGYGLRLLLHGVRRWLCPCPETQRALAQTRGYFGASWHMLRGTFEE